MATLNTSTALLMTGFLSGVACMMALGYAARQFKTRRGRRLFVIGSLVVIVVAMVALFPRVTL